MATVLDLGLLFFFMPFFIFLFVFVLIYALLSKTKLFGDNQAVLNFVGAICIAAISVFTGTVNGVITNTIPWIVLVIVVLLLLFGLFMFFGVSDTDKIWDTLGGKTVIYVIIIIIVFIGLTKTFEKDISPYKDQSGNIVNGVPGSSGQQGVQGAVISTLTHPRLLGALFILIVSALSIKIILDKT